MRILIPSVGHFCDRPGGGERIAHEEAVELRRRGHDVWVLAPGSPEQPEHEMRDGIHLLRYAPKQVTVWNPARVTCHQTGAKAVLSKYLPKVDAIHGHATLQHLAALDQFRDSAPSCYHIHSPARMELAIVWKGGGFFRRTTAAVGLPLINRIEKECLRRSNIISAHSQFTIQCIAKLHGDAIAEKVRLLPGWVDTSRYVIVQDRREAKVRLKWPLDVPVLFTLRRLTQRMGVDRLLSAAHQLHSRGMKFHLMIGGDGPMRNELEQRSRSLGLDRVVTFLGHLSDEVLPISYGACDVFVLPTAALECFGLIALEALSTGRPVLATPVGAIPEIIRKIEPLWLARSSESDDIAKLLHEYITDVLPKHPPEELRRKVCQEYDRERLLSEFIESTVEKGNFAAAR